MVQLVVRTVEEDKETGRMVMVGWSDKVPNDPNVGGKRDMDEERESLA